MNNSVEKKNHEKYTAPVLRAKFSHVTVPQPRFYDYYNIIHPL